MSKVNYDIFNALNLISVNLGDAYLQEGFNPFDEGFSLEEPAVKEMLSRQKEKENIQLPEFLERDNLEIMKSFENALNIGTNLLQTCEITAGIKNEVKIKEAKVFLKMRCELLRQALKKLHIKDINALALYKDIISINPEYSKLLQDSFNPNKTHENAIQAFNNFFQISMQKDAMDEVKNTFLKPKNSKSQAKSNLLEK